MAYSYKEGDIVVFPEGGTPRLGKFVKLAEIGDNDYAEVDCDGRTHIVNMDYLKPHGKTMDENNPNKTFRLQECKKALYRPHATEKQNLEHGREVIESVKRIRLATGVGLKEAREAIAEAEWDAQVAIERIKLKHYSSISDDMENFLDDIR